MSRCKEFTAVALLCALSGEDLLREVPVRFAESDSQIFEGAVSSCSNAYVLVPAFAHNRRMTPLTDNVISPYPCRNSILKETDLHSDKIG